MPDQFPPRTWSEMSDWMESIYGVAFNRTPSMHHLCRKSGIPLESIEGVADELAAAEENFADEIERYVKQICTKGTLSLKKCSPGAIALLRTRISAVQSWVWSIECNGKSLVPFPTIPFRKFATWLFTDWWEEYGRESAAENMIAEAVDTEHTVRECKQAGWILPGN
jgi:hypothetical protein